jgi:deoxyribodipyrimidine photo-lyase
MPPKRKATSPVRPSPSKKQETAFNHSRIAEEAGIIQREFYPPELSNERCAQYNNNELPRPIEVLNAAIKDAEKDRAKIKAGECVVHWFKRDLRIADNKGLSLASKKAREAGVPLICMFLVSPQDWTAHVTSAVRVDFELRTLETLQKSLQEHDVPLYMATIEKRKNVASHVAEKCSEWGAKHVFCNIEYEPDELRREAKLVRMCLEKGIDFAPSHDDVIVPPGDLSSGAGKQYSVYSPWYRSWVRHIHQHPHLLDEAEPISTNPTNTTSKFKSIFNMPVPPRPSNKILPDPDQKRLASYWPAGEHAAQDRLSHFLQDKIKQYSSTRNFPFAHNTSLISPHLAAGTLSARATVRAARNANSSRNLDAGNAGTVTWISELAWRDFYKHVLCHWPYVAMSKAFKYEYSDVEWEYNDEHFKAWCEGRTGYPIVDAAMRQLRAMGWMHNRCRMIVGSFLAKDLLLDWRLGEKFFMESLIDGDFASNNGGWGFSASTGVDPQPYFRIFNPTLQSEKFDEGGEYIRKWVPELKDIKVKAIHEPYARGAEAAAKKAGYPRPIVEHKQARARALERYKGGLGRGTANVGGGVHN